MRVSFTKMHGLGNDFVVLDGRETPLPALSEETARAIADRHEGIGCDQVIVLAQSKAADFAMRIFNSDGSEVEACGNASRAAALFHGAPAKIETRGGLIHVSPEDGGAKNDGAKIGGASVDMGEPRFDWEAIPLAYAVDTVMIPLGWEELDHPAAVNVGNPHAVFFVEDCDAVPLDRLGPIIENDAFFPQKVNVNVAEIISRTHIKLRVWERGAGLTRACGTGACASAVAAMRRGLTEREVTISLPGGDLSIAWEKDGRITMRGPAQESFRGTFEWGDFA